MFKKKIIFLILSFLILHLLILGNVMAAGGNINELKMVVEVGRDKSVSEVKLNYNLKIEENTKEIPLTSLLISDTNIKDVRAVLDGENLEVELDDSNLPVLTGKIILPDGLQASDDVPLQLNYLVENSMNRKGDSFVFETPVLVVKWIPATTQLDLFNVETKLPGKAYIEENFPSTPKTVERNGDVTSVAMSLQTVPAMVRLSGSIGKPVFLTYGRKVDLLVILILIVGGYFGWKALKKEK